MSDYPGYFIVFEGGEGSGTTYHSQRIVQELNKLGLDAEWTYEPGGPNLRTKFLREGLLAKPAILADIYANGLGIKEATTLDDFAPCEPILFPELINTLNEGVNNGNKRCELVLAGMYASPEELQKIVTSGFVGYDGPLKAPSFTRFDPTTELYLFGLTRHENTAKKILPALQAGKIVVSDRHRLSTDVYQGMCKQLGLEKTFAVNDTATIGIKPDLTIYMDIPPEIGLKRKSNDKAENNFEDEKIDFHENVRRFYQEILRNHYPESAHVTFSTIIAHPEGEHMTREGRFHDLPASVVSGQILEEIVKRAA